MNDDRRKFICASSSLVLATLLSPVKILAEITYVPNLVHSRSGFEARINHWFYLYNADATHQGNLELVSVSEEGSNSQVEQFALTLRSHLSAMAMPTGYYEVANQSFHLYMKHTHEEDGRQFYRALFSLLRVPSQKANAR